MHAYISDNDKKQSKVLSNLSKITLNFWTVCINDKKKLALNSGIQTNQILTKDDEVGIPSLSSILLAVLVYVYCYQNIWQINLHSINVM